MRRRYGRVGVRGGGSGAAGGEGRWVQLAVGMQHEFHPEQRLPRHIEPEPSRQTDMALLWTWRRADAVPTLAPIGNIGGGTILLCGATSGADTSARPPRPESPRIDRLLFLPWHQSFRFEFAVLSAMSRISRRFGLTPIPQMGEPRRDVGGIDAAARKPPREFVPLGCG